MLLLNNVTLYTGTSVEYNRCIGLADNQIAYIGSNQTPPQCDPGQILSLPGFWVAPGFIDLQINGAAGINLNPAMRFDQLKGVQTAIHQQGCTDFLATLISSSTPDQIEAIASVKHALQQLPSLLGLHLEGPWISPLKAGIHNPTHIRMLTQQDVDRLCSSASVVRLITLAPESVSTPCLKSLLSAGIEIAIGHSHATYAEAIQGFEQGIRLATHLFNAMSPFQSRDPGVVGAVLINPSIYAGVIPDGYHVHWDALKLAIRQKPRKICLVTDGTVASGCSANTFTFADKKIIVEDQKCTDEFGTLAGSALTMIAAFQNAVTRLKVPVEEALRMCSLYPAQALRLSHKLGKLELGYKAHLTVIKPDLSLAGVVINEEWIPKLEE